VKPGLGRTFKSGAAGEASTGQLLALALILSLYLFSRVPFYTQPLVGEEGIFAHLLGQSPPGPSYVLMGRIQGVNLYAPPMHPGPLYGVYAGLGRVLRAAANLSGAAVTPSDFWARMVQSGFEGILWVCLALRFGASPRRGLLLGLLLLGLSSPLGMSASIYLQADTSSGLLCCGLLGLALAEAEGFLWPALALFALAALGKQEWGAVALGALGCSEAWARWRNLPRPDSKRRWACLGAAFVLGHLCNFAFDPLNYGGGLAVFHSVSQQQSGAWSVSWLRLWPARRPFVLSLLAMLLPSAWLAFSAPLERRSRELDACALAWALFLLFFLSAWNDSPRYFAPAWGAGLCCFASQLAVRRPGPKGLAAALLAFAVISLLQALFLEGFWMRQRSLTDFPFNELPAMLRQEDAQAAFVKPGCVPRLPTGYAWNRPLDFIGSGIDDGQAAALAQAHGEVLCLEPPHP
jgi:hypothetical protein